MNVAVLGGSHGAYATAADLTLANHRIRLWRRNKDDLSALAAGITLQADGRQGVAKLDRATADLREAVDGADVVVVPLPATTHADIARRLAPVLTEQQIVVLTPGTLGSFVVARELARAGGALPWALAETGTLPYLTRKTGPAAVGGGGPRRPPPPPTPAGGGGRPGPAPPTCPSASFPRRARKRRSLVSPSSFRPRGRAWTPSTSP